MNFFPFNTVMLHINLNDLSQNDSVALLNKVQGDEFPSCNLRPI